MNDTEGCLLYLVLGGVLFLCINVARDLNIRPIIMFLFILAFGLVCLGILLLHYTIDNKRNERIKTKANEIQDKYPRAYRRFLLEKGYYSKNESLRIDIYKEAVKRDIAIWEKEEAALKEEYDAIKKRELEQTAQFNELVNKYPHGIERLKKEQPNATSRELIKAEGTIKKYENDYLDYVRIKQWYDAQLEFSKCSRRSIIEKCGCQFFEFSYYGIDINGDEIEYRFPVWQHYLVSFCNDDSLDYTWAPRLQENAKRVGLLRNKQRTLKQIVFDKVLSFIDSLPPNTEVLFADGFWTVFDSEYYEGVFRYFKEQLDKNGIKYFDLKNIESFPAPKDRQYFVIVGLFAKSQNVKEDSLSVLDAFPSNPPGITYCSIFRELSSEEAQCIIEKRKKEAQNKQAKIVESLKEKYPLSIAYYKKEHPGYSDNDLIQREKELEELEQILSQINRYREWTKKQNDCYNETKERIESVYNKWEFHEHYVPSTIGNEEVSEAFLLFVPRIELWPFSYDSSIDDSLFPSYKTRAESISLVEKNGPKIPTSFMNRVLLFLKQYPNPRVVFADSGRRDSFPMLNQYHFSSLRDLLEHNGIPYCDVEDDLVLKQATNDTFIIVELISKAGTVSTNCSKVLLAHDKNCCLVYFSFWYEVSSEELSVIIEQKGLTIKKPYTEESTITVPVVQKKALALKQNYQRFKDYLETNNVSFFFHFTDIRNIESIKKNGGLYSWRYCEEHDIHIENAGGDETSKYLDTKHGLDDYVRLSFCTDHPMAWRLKQDGCTLVLLKIKAEVAWFQGTLFSDINAADNAHHHGPSLDDLKRVDINATRMHYLPNTSEFFKKHQAEVLVKTHVPLEYIVNIDNPDEF